MTQREAVIQTLERLGGIATLGTLYQEVFKIAECTWKTKTPFASIRQIVQLAPEIYKIKPGLWALESHRKELESNGIFEQTEKNKESAEVKNFNHSYYQGLLLTMGNLRGKNTFVPNQDKNKRFDERTLGQIRTLNSISEYSFSDIVQRARYAKIDAPPSGDIYLGIEGIRRFDTRLGTVYLSVPKIRQGGDI